MNNPYVILQSHKLRITDCRLEIIQEFLEKNIALSHSDLEEKLRQQFDRVTIYRTLKTFLEKDLIHKVLDDSFTYRYANDILKWSFEAWLAGETVRVSCGSKAACEHTIETERQEMVDAIKDILNNTVNWYISKVEQMFSVLNIKLPKVDVNSRPLELYWIPQIEGETEAIRVSF